MALSDLIFLGIAFGLLLMVAGFSLAAASNLNNVFGISAYPNLKAAQSYLKWSGYLAIISIILILIVLIMSFFLHFNSGKSKLIGIIAVAVIIILTLISGFLTIMAYSSLRTNTVVSSVGSMGSAKNLALLAAYAAFAIVILLIIYLIILVRRHAPHLASTKLAPEIQLAADQAASQTLAQSTVLGKPNNQAAAQIAATATTQTLTELESHGVTADQIKAITPKVTTVAAQLAAAGGNLDQTVTATRVSAQNALNPSAQVTPQLPTTQVPPPVVLPPPTIPAPTAAQVAAASQANGRLYYPINPSRSRRIYRD